MMTHLDIIVLLVVVFVIFQKLKNILGTRPEESSKAKISEESAAKIFDIIMKENIKNAAPETSPTPKSETIEAINLSEPDKTLSQIPNFNKEKFMQGAKKAFEVIITAFSKGDTATLEMLVNKTLFKKFQDIIEKRSQEGVLAETDFIGFEKAEIKEAKISKNNIAKITVEFISEQVNLLKNSKGEVIEGDDKFIQNITDNWTFEKTITSTNPNWLLVSTKK